MSYVSYFEWKYTYQNQVRASQKVKPSQNNKIVFLESGYKKLMESSPQIFLLKHTDYYQENYDFNTSNSFIFILLLFLQSDYFAFDFKQEVGVSLFVTRQTK